MIIIKRINNNVLYVNENGDKKVVMGKGIGFQVYPNDVVDTSKIEKTFVLKNDLDVNQFISMINNVSQEIIDVTNLIIEEASTQLNKKLNDNLIITLSDHINFALKRLRKGMVLRNPLHFEIKQLYREEVDASRKAITIIKDKTGVILPEEEVVFIATHLVNAQYEYTTDSSSTQMITMIFDVLHIIKYHFQIDLDEETQPFLRFITHLRYYLIRNLDLNKINNVTIEKSILLDVVISMYPEEYECANKIILHFNKLYGWKESEEEKMYLILHIHRVVEAHSKMNV